MKLLNNMLNREIKKNVLVTIADKNYVDQAKQLFSGVFWNAGWDGDYLLLSQGIQDKDLKWFKDKGIMVYECEPLYHKKVGQKKIKYPPIVLSKFYLFREYFKQWERVVFLDSDILVRSSIEDFKKIKGFASVGLNIHKNYLGEFIQYSKQHIRKIKKMKKNFNLDKEVFNTGVMVFSTDIIKKNTFNDLLKLFMEYKDITQGDDPIINLFFYDKWIKLPKMYNILVKTNNKDVLTRFNKPEKIKGVILHFSSRNLKDKPWDKRNFFYKEWYTNFKKAGLINLSKIPKPKEPNRLEIEKYLFDLKVNIVLFLKRANNSEKNKNFVHKWSSW